MIMKISINPSFECAFRGRKDLISAFPLSNIKQEWERNKETMPYDDRILSKCSCENKDVKKIDAIKA